jgi:hypothetical protein
MMIASPSWDREQLDAARIAAIDVFRTDRIEEPLEAYLNNFDNYQGVIEDLLETTVDLTDLDSTALDILTDQKMLEAFRYIPGPPISADDLRVVADAALSKSRLKAEPEMVRRIVQVILAGLDRRRFPWVAEAREASDAERNAAVIASTALIAMRRTETSRRSEEKNKQEGRVEASLLEAGFTKVASPRSIRTVADAPGLGEFCRESKLGTRKADLIVRLWDQRIMPIECKVSNSSTNSIKRLNNDAAVKAKTWLTDFGERHIVPTAVLSGVYKLRNLQEAQTRGLVIFWAHDLQKMIEWIELTR